MAIKGTKISETTEKLEIEGAEFIPIVDTDGTNKKVKSFIVKRSERR